MRGACARAVCRVACTRFYLFLACFCFGFPVSAQAPVLQTLQTLSDTALDEPFAVVVSPDNQYVYGIDTNDNVVAVFSRDLVSGALTQISHVKNFENDVFDLSGPQMGVFSSDGKFLYVPCFFGNSVVVFARNDADGSLTYLESVLDGVNGVAGLGGPVFATISQDGSFLYVASAGSAVAAFTRESDGTLTFIEAALDGAAGVSELGQPTGVAVSPDGRQVYATSATDNALCVLTVDLPSGSLSFLESHVNAQNGVSGLAAPSSVVISSDGLFVYAGGEVGSVAVFSRNNTTGELTFQEAQIDGVLGVDGMQGAKALALSPSETELYVTASSDDAIATFSRDVVTGALSFEEAAFDALAGVDGLNGAYGLAVAPDGAHVYVAGPTDHDIAVFDRGGVNGFLTFATHDVVPSQAGIDGLYGAYRAALSPDGAHLYVVAQFDNTVAWFPRDPATGLLGSSTILRDDDNNGTVGGLTGANGIAMSPDGMYVYISASSDNTVAVFSRDPGSGDLTFVEFHIDGVLGVSGIHVATSVVLSPDAADVYVTGYGSNAIAAFRRNAISGALTFLEAEADDVLGVDGLVQPTDAALDSQGGNVYVTSSGDSALVVFTRNPDNGLLTYLETHFDGFNGVEGLGDAFAVVVSPDDAFVYAAGQSDRAIAIFARDLVTGALTYKATTTEGGNGMAISPDGVYLFALDKTAGELYTYLRDASSGLLQLVDTISGPSGATWPLTTADGGHLYTMNDYDNSLHVLGKGVFSSVTGFVRDLATSNTLSCAAVEYANAGRTVVRRAVSDENGFYFVENLPPDAYTIRAFAPGYGPSIVSTPVVIDPGVTQERDVFVTPASLSAAIRGHVADADTLNPLVAVLVEARIGGELVASTYTCASGDYELNHLLAKGAATDVTLSFELENYDPEQQTAMVEPGAVTDADQSMEKSVTGAATLAGVVFAAAEGGDTVPLQGATVTLSGTLNTSTKTDGSGVYLFGALLNGSYTIRASATGYGGETGVRFLSPGGVANANFTLQPGVPPVPPAIMVSPTERSVGCGAGAFGVAVTNAGGGTLQWSAAVIEGGSWLSAVTGTVMGAGEIPVIYGANATAVPRIGIIRITSNSAGLSPLDVTVTQGRRGDVNADGAANAVDIQLVINGALGLDTLGFNADINGDATVNAIDVQLAVNAALGV